MDLARQNQFTEAAECSQQATTLKPAFLEAWTNLENCQLMLQRLDEAKASYERALSIDPDDRTARQNLGILSEIRQNR
ncbi:MAG: tetratricopeptide repeat protein [Opitutales bacterium]|nr:tetratricopeptide repeat protein [Opitutales bacterium]